jgi:cyanosortase A-associated protein
MSKSLVSRWQSIRVLAIALTFGGVLWVLARAILLPGIDDEKRLGSFDFPATIPVKGWEFIKANPLKTNTPEQSHLGKIYTYQQKGDRLEITMRYEQYADGNIGRMLVAYTSIKPATVRPQIEHNNEVGFYTLFEYQQKAYLSACINYAGQTTATEQQFVQNKYAHGWSWQRTLLWVIGQNDLFDGRCLWTLLSTPLPENADFTSTEKAYQDLETAWVDWHDWWKQKLED